MSTLLRWFSPAYRHALQAEAEGRYIDAARAYALCGQRLKVAEMHLLEAERRGAPASVLRELHVAAHFLADRSPASQALRLRIGQLYLRVLKKSVLTPAERELCTEAAELLLSADDPAGAAAAYELGGDLERAAAAYEQAGEIERVELLLSVTEAKRRTVDAERHDFATYRTQLELGQRAEALAALRRYAAVAADPAEAQRLLTELRQRLLPPGQVRLRLGGDVGGSETLYVGRFPLLLGRGGPGQPQAGGLPLPDLGLSREHAQIEYQADAAVPSFVLRDLGSKNGTSLGGLPIAAALPLRGEGEIGLGQQVQLRFVAAPGLLTLTVERGGARGMRTLASPLPFALADGVALHFDPEDGQPRVTPTAAATGDLLLNGKRAPRQIQLLRGDVLAAAGHRYEVL